MTSERARFWLLAAAALAAGLLLRLWFITHQPRVFGDTFLYGDIAKNWIQNGAYGFTDDPAPRPTLIRLPGYPLFLAACFRLFGMEHYRAVLNVQAAADLITCTLAAALAARLFGRRAFLPVLWIAALCPFTAGYAAAALTETLSLLSIAAAFYFLVRWRDAGRSFNRWLWLLAAALAYAILLRPEQVLLAASILPAMLWIALAPPVSSTRAHRLAPVVAAALLCVLPLVPWTIRNWRTFQVFQPLAPRYANDPGEQPTLGFDLWFRTWGIDFASNEEAYWNINGAPIDPANLPRRAFARGCAARHPDPAIAARTLALLAQYNRTIADSPDLEARFAALAHDRIHADPVCYYIVLPIARVLNMAFRPRIEITPIPLHWWTRPTRPAQTAFAWGYAALNLAYFAAALAGLLAWKRRAWLAARPIAWAMVAVILLRILLLLTLDNSEPRYTLEFFPIFFVWTGALFIAPRRSHPPL